MHARDTGLAECAGDGGFVRITGLAECAGGSGIARDTGLAECAGYSGFARDTGLAECAGRGGDTYTCTCTYHVRAEAARLRGAREQRALRALSCIAAREQRALRGLRCIAALLHRCSAAPLLRCFAASLHQLGVLVHVALRWAGQEYGRRGSCRCQIDAIGRRN